MGEKLKIAMLGQKRVPSHEGGIEIVVEELSTRMAAKGHDVTLYNRGGHHVSGKEFDSQKLTEYKSVKLKSVPTIDRKGLAAVSSSFFGALRAAFGKYDVVHIHAEGPAFFAWLPKMLGKRVVVTVHGIDWQREKWQSGFGSKFIRQGEKNAVKYADEVIVLSKGVQKYFMDTYGRETHFIPNGVNRPQIREANLITEKFELKKDSYILFLGRLVPEKGIRYLVEAFKNVKTDKKLVIAGGSSDTDSFMEELKELAKGDNRILFTGFVQGAMLDELYSNKDMNKFVFIYAWISGWCAVCLFCMFQPFMEIWMGCEMLFPMIDVVLICLYFYSLTMGDVRSQYSSAAGLFWENRKYVLVEALSNIVLNYILGKLFGVHGIIAATLISILLINFIWGSAILFKCYFKDYKVGEFYKKHFFYFGVAIIAAISRALPWSSWSRQASRASRR